MKRNATAVFKEEIVLLAITFTSQASSVFPQKDTIVQEKRRKKKTKGAVLLLHHGHVRNSEFLVQRDNVPVRVLDLPRGSDAWPRAEW